jgi:hypothetical protein
LLCWLLAGFHHGVLMLVEHLEKSQFMAAGYCGDDPGIGCPPTLPAFALGRRDAIQTFLSFGTSGLATMKPAAATLACALAPT